MVSDISASVVLSSIVIGLSLAIAFSAWARGAIFGAFDRTFGFLTRPVVKRKQTKTRNLTSASAQVIREFMIAKQKEWEGRHTTNGTTSGALPLHRGQSGKSGGSGMIERLWRRKSG